jgi:hypothetical protein
MDLIQKINGGICNFIIVLFRYQPFAKQKLPEINYQERGKTHSTYYKILLI